MRHLLDTTDLSLEEVDGIISTAIDIINNKEKYAHVCDGKKLATLFFEPSTRTRLSKKLSSQFKSKSAPPTT